MKSVLGWSLDAFSPRSVSEEGLGAALQCKRERGWKVPCLPTFLFVLLGYFLPLASSSFNHSKEGIQTQSPYIKKVRCKQVLSLPLHKHLYTYSIKQRDCSGTCRYCCNTPRGNHVVADKREWGNPTSLSLTPLCRPDSFPLYLSKCCWSPLFWRSLFKQCTRVYHTLLILWFLFRTFWSYEICLPSLSLSLNLHPFPLLPPPPVALRVLWMET